MAGKGGAIPGNGRKSAKDELNFRIKLDKYTDDAIKAISEGVKRGDLEYIKLFCQYMWKKPDQTVNQNTEGKLRVVYETDGSETSFTPPTPSAVTHYT